MFYKYGIDFYIVKWKFLEENIIDFKFKLYFLLVELDDMEKVDGVFELFVDYDSVFCVELFIWLGNSSRNFVE